MTSRVPGPLCQVTKPQLIDDGTLHRTTSPQPGPFGIDLSSNDILPSIESCRAESSVLNAHKRALAILTETIDYFKNIRQTVASKGTVEEVATAMGEKAFVKVSNSLTVPWQIFLEQEVRQGKGLSLLLSRQQIAKEILTPLDNIIAVYKTIQENLAAGDFKYFCEYKDDLLYIVTKCGERDAVDGYVRTLGGIPVGGIHLCMDELKDINNTEKLARLIIHEASHKFAGTDDTSDIPWKNAHKIIDGLPSKISSRNPN